LATFEAFKERGPRATTNTAELDHRCGLVKKGYDAKGSRRRLLDSFKEASV
jgi:hypothetical protein